MALLRCKECGKKISELAENCPHCGCPMRQQKNNMDTSEQIVDDIQNAVELASHNKAELSYYEKKKKRIVRIIFSIVFIITGIIFVFIPFNAREEITRSELLRWYLDTIENGTLNEQISHYLGYIPDDDASRRIINVAYIENDFYEYQTEKLSGKIFLRQLPFFIFAAGSFCLAFILIKDLKKYSLLKGAV